MAAAQPVDVRREFNRGLLRFPVALYDAHIDRVGGYVDGERRWRRSGRYGRRLDGRRGWRRDGGVDRPARHRGRIGLRGLLLLGVGRGATRQYHRQHHRYRRSSAPSVRGYSK
jgi:hypothetical protein